MRPKAHMLHGENVPANCMGRHEALANTICHSGGLHTFRPYCITGPQYLQNASDDTKRQCIRLAGAWAHRRVTHRPTRNAARYATCAGCVVVRCYSIAQLQWPSWSVLRLNGPARRIVTQYHWPTPNVTRWYCKSGKIIYTIRYHFSVMFSPLNKISNFFEHVAVLLYCTRVFSALLMAPLERPFRFRQFCRQHSWY